MKDEALASTLLLEPLVNCGPAGVNFVAYEESTSDTSLSTRMTDAERHWTGPLGGSWPIGGDPPPGAWDHVYRHEEDTISHARSTHAEGAGKINVPPETSGSFAFTEYSGSDHLVQHNESTHTGSFYLSEMPLVQGSFTFENGKHVDTEARTTLVSGMTARTDTDHSYVRWHGGDFYWDGELFFSGASSSLETSAASLTFQLAPPSPTNLHNLHIHGRTDLALGSNLYGQGLLRGIVEASSASGLVPVVRGGVTSFGTQDETQTVGANEEGDGPREPMGAATAQDIITGETYVEIPRQSSNLFVNDFDFSTNTSAAASRLGDLLGTIGKLRPGDIGFEVNGHGQVRLTFSENARDLIRKALAMEGLDPGMRGLLEAALGTGGPKQMWAGGPGFMVGDGWGVGNADWARKHSPGSYYAGIFGRGIANGVLEPWRIGHDLVTWDPTQWTSMLGRSIDDLIHNSKDWRDALTKGIRLAGNVATLGLLNLIEGIGDGLATGDWDRAAEGSGAILGGSIYLPPIMAKPKAQTPGTKSQPKPATAKQVTSWAERGITPDLNPGRWVQLGGPTLWNWLKTGLWGGRFALTSRFPYFWRPGNAPRSNFITGMIEAARLVWPSGVVDIAKGFLGQRRVK